MSVEDCGRTLAEIVVAPQRTRELRVIEPQLHEMLGTGPNARPVTERGVRAAQAAKYGPKTAVKKREENKEGQSVHAMGEWWNNYAKFNKYQGFK